MRGTPIIISACLLGLSTRHDGSDAYNKEVVDAEDSAVLIPVCPEQLGGLTTPRPRAQITRCQGAEVLNGQAVVVDTEGNDVTKEFVKGAREVLKIARLAGAKTAYLKEKSPSCGVTLIKRDGINLPGKGVTATLLENVGIKIKGF